MRGLKRSLAAAGLGTLMLAAGVVGQEIPEIFDAILDGDADAVRSALDDGVDPNLTVDGRTPLMFAVWRGEGDLVDLLMDRGADPALPTELGIPLVGIAAEIGSTELLQRLLDRGADINARGMGIRAQFEDDPQREQTPLMIAAQYAPRAKLASTVQFLVEHGADVDAQDTRGWTALMMAVRRNDIATLQCIIDAGADLDITNNDGETALDRARQLVQDPPVVEQTLLEAGARGG